MNKLKHIKIVAFLFLIITNVSFSQSDTNDLSLWSSIGINYSPTKKLDFELEQQLRLKENISETDKYFTQLSAEYEVFKNLKLGGGVRYIKENDNEGAVQGYENHFRFHLDASYKQSLNNFDIKYRVRYQNENELGVSNEEGDYANQHIRFKTSIGYNIKKWKLDPEISAEIFNHFEKGDENGYDKYRLSIGTDYKFKKLGKIGIFYMFEKELNESIPETTNIIGLNYSYTIKNK